jgi:hypothetical protein
MTGHRKGYAGSLQTTPKTSNHTRRITGLVALIKAGLVILALWGLLPIAAADWLMHLGGQHDL